MTSLDIVQVVESSGVFLDVYEGFSCHNQEYNPYKEIVTNMFEKRDLIKSQGKDLLQKIAKKIGFSVFLSLFRKDVDEKCKSVTETWMREKF